MSVHHIYFQDGRKMMRAVTSREEYLSLRNSESNRRADKQHMVQMNYSCLPNDDGSLRGSTRMSNTVGMDVDHIAPEQMPIVGDRILSHKDELCLKMLEESARGAGYHLVFGRRADMSQEANLLWASELLGVEYDAGAKDITRVFFTPADKLIYLDDSIFEVEEVSKAEEVSGSAGSSTEFSGMASEVSCLSYKNIPYNDIVNALLVVTGNAGGAIEGERNTVYFTLCNNMRYICDFKADVLMQVLPDFGLSVDERRQAIHSSLGRPRRDNMPVTLLSAINMARSLGKEDDREEKGVAKAAELPLPVLPPLLKTLCSRLPEPYHSALVMSCLPLLGTLATKLRFTYLDGQEQSPSFFTVCVAPAASGKSFIRKPFELLKTPLLDHDQLSEQAEKEYLKKKAAAKNSKNQPEDPEVFYRIQPINISIAKYLQQQSRAGDLHLYSEAEEMDTLVKSESRGAWSQKSDLYRVGFDNQTYGQSYMNTEFTCSATVNVYYNLYVSGTPKSMERFFKDIENGLATRVSVVQLPDTTYSDMPHFGTYSAKEKEEILRWVKKLNASEGEIRCLEVDKAIARWLEGKRQQAIDSDSRAADVFRRRSAVIGWRAGMLSTLLYEGKKSGQMAAAFAEYAAEYTFRGQMNLWGDRMEQEIAAGDDITGGRGEATALLSRLPEEFTTQMLIALRSKAGQSVKPNAINTLLSRWKKLGRITKVGEAMFRRLN